LHFRTAATCSALGFGPLALASAAGAPIVTASASVNMAFVRTFFIVVSSVGG
jgi:hypothetical protein